MRPLFFEWDAIPVLGDLDVPSYFLMLTIGFLVGSSVLVREARRGGGKVVDYLDLSLIVLITGLIGSRLAHVFMEAPWIELPVPAQSNEGWGHYFCRAAGESHAVRRDWNLGRYYFLHPQMVAAVWNGGIVYYGGLMLGIPAGLWFGCQSRVQDCVFGRGGGGERSANDRLDPFARVQRHFPLRDPQGGDGDLSGEIGAQVNAYGDMIR